MPDNQDHADLGELLSPRERWSDADAARGATDARKPGPSRYRLRPAEQDLGSLPWRVVHQLDEALAAFDAAR